MTCGRIVRGFARGLSLTATALLAARPACFADATWLFMLAFISLAAFVGWDRK